jgi:hypothetical protein
MTFDQAVQAVKWLMGGLAAIAAFLLVQSDIVLSPLIEVVLGAFLVFAAYVNPASIVVKAGTARQMGKGEG